MAKIEFIAVHHAGGIGQNSMASSLYLTPEHINQAHRQRWNFRSTLGYYGGYNAVYDPKTRQFTQFRAVGEETAAQKGFNRNTFSLCIIGNYTKGVDSITKQTKDDVGAYLSDLMSGNKRGLAIIPGTIVDLSASRINPHRYYQVTDCYGNSLPDIWARNAVIEYEWNKYYAPFIKLLISLKIITQPLPMLELGAEFERSCSGCVELIDN